jgi:ribokinase
LWLPPLSNRKNARIANSHAHGIQMALEYFTSGGMRIDYVITADHQAHLREMGGNAIYSAVGARIWSADVGILSRVGENYPQEWLDRLDAAGIRTTGVRRIPGWQEMRTFYAYTDLETRDDLTPERHFAEIGTPMPQELNGYVNSTPGQDGEGYIAVSPRPADLLPPYLAVKAAHLAPLELAAHCSLCEELSAAGICTSLDPGERYMTPHHLERVMRFLGHVEVFMPSEQEVRSLLGPIDLWDAACRFADAGPSAVVIKVGARGALVYDRRFRSKHRVPAIAEQVVDVTGAGDSFCGGFMVGYRETGDPVLAACYGAVSASFVLQGFGALYATRFSRSDALARLEKARAIIDP